jgi:hypothetical protein
MKTLRRTIHPVARVLDAAKGIVEYVASNETIDSYREVIRVSGWRFDLFRKNAPFVDSHNYGTLDCLLGKVLDFKLDQVDGKPALVETVQWAIDVAENKLAQLGFKMTQAGYAKAVSVGFWPVKAVSKWDQDPGAYTQQLLELGLAQANAPRVIYLEQQQVELSACILGANPDALAKAYRADLLKEEDIEFLASEGRKNLLLEEPELETAGPATVPAEADPALQRASLNLLATVIEISNGL